MSNETRAVVERLYEAYLAGDADGMRAEMAEDVEVRFLGHAELRGLDAVRRYQEFAGGLLTDLDFRVRKLIVDGEVAAAIWDETARTADGRPWENHGVDVIRVRGGRIVSLHENNDVTLVHRHFPRYAAQSAEASREAVPTLRGERVLLRPVRPSDADRLTEILSEPEVARWWVVGGSDPESLARELVAEQDDVVFAVEHGGELIGGVQYYEEADPDYRHAGIDIFLSASRHGQGLGPETLRVLARYLFDECGHHRLVIDPAADNERAIRAYVRVGFRPVGVMRQYERGSDGTWHDGLLMDLLRAELR